MFQAIPVHLEHAISDFKVTSSINVNVRNGTKQ